MQPLLAYECNALTTPKASYTGENLHQVSLPCALHWQAFVDAVNLKLIGHCIDSLQTDKL
jgi:hypothetical protein